MTKSTGKRHHAPRHAGTTLAERLDYFTIPEALTGCHLYWGHPHPLGYPTLRVDGVRWRASRLQWTICNGPIPAGQHVLHRCDTPACVNIDHLFLGTPADNTADRVRKGRQARGERNGFAKLTETEVCAIYGEAGTQRALAEKYGVHQATIHNIKSGKRWQHITGAGGEVAR